MTWDRILCLIVLSVCGLAMMAVPILQLLMNREIAKERRYLDNNPIKED